MVAKRILHTPTDQSHSAGHLWHLVSISFIQTLSAKNRIGTFVTQNVRVTLTEETLMKSWGLNSTVPSLTRLLHKHSSVRR